MKEKILDILIIGAGQAGLLTAYYLKKSNLSVFLVDSHKRIGDAWRKRYDNLRLLTPRSEDQLPGFKLSGDPEGFPSKDEIANYLEKFAKRFSLPVKLGVTVRSLTKSDKFFLAQTNKGILYARKVIIATGAFQSPLVPTKLNIKSKKIHVLHTSKHKNYKSIPNGKVLVVGAGNSGAQIAAELSKTHPVTLSSKRSLIFHSKFDFLYVLATKVIPTEMIKRVVEFLRISRVQTKNLEGLLETSKIVLKPELVKVKDKYFIFKDGATDKFNSVIFATGYKFDFSFIQIPGLFDKDRLVHKNGASSIQGLYFIYPEKDYGFIKDLPKRVRKLVDKITTN